MKDGARLTSYLCQEKVEKKKENEYGWKWKLLPDISNSNFNGMSFHPCDCLCGGGCFDWNIRLSSKALWLCLFCFKWMT